MNNAYEHVIADLRYQLQQLNDHPDRHHPGPAMQRRMLEDRLYMVLSSPSRV